MGFFDNIDIEVKNIANSIQEKGDFRRKWVFYSSANDYGIIATLEIGEIPFLEISQMDSTYNILLPNRGSDGLVLCGILSLTEAQLKCDNIANLYVGGIDDK